MLEPDRPGEYAMHITGPDGMTILYDELHVDRLGTTYSMQSGNFTGDNAVVGGVALFFLGLAAIALVHFCGFSLMLTGGSSAMAARKRPKRASPMIVRVCNINGCGSVFIVISALVRDTRNRRHR